MTICATGAILRLYLHCVQRAVATNHSLVTTKHLSARTGEGNASAIERSKRSNITKGCCLDLSCAGLSRHQFEKHSTCNVRPAMQEQPTARRQCENFVVSSTLPARTGKEEVQARL